MIEQSFKSFYQLKMSNILWLQLLKWEDVDCWLTFDYVTLDCGNLWLSYVMAFIQLN